MASSSHLAYPNIQSILSETSLENLEVNACIPSSFRLRLPGLQDRPYNPPRGYITFFLEQLEEGLRFPVPEFLCRISKSFGVPLSEIVPNSIRLLLSFFMILSYVGEVPTTQLWRDFYHAKPSNPLGFFYFTSLGFARFIDGIPNSNKAWKKKYFFISAPDPWSFPTKWITELPHQGPSPTMSSFSEAAVRAGIRSLSCPSCWIKLDQMMNERIAARVRAQKASNQSIHPE
ncbi:hypothetical protein DH2020_022235 [Rehmannia glutinosa]|uniref:Transposase (putative) gypsy type domain-containing protein n=1 Tax=Rehmannia glutinosa TaxID=99300 RepID=A0ABR0WE46_REHGL